MGLKFIKIAIEFAQAHGFDGVLPDANPRLLTDGSEQYNAGFYHEELADGINKGWSPTFDDTGHGIIVDPNGNACWLDGNDHGRHTYSQDFRNPLIPDVETALSYM